MPYRMPDYGGADTLDGLDSTAFFILAGQAGGQVGIGGTAASNILTFESTSHATKGYIHFRDDLRLASGSDIFDANSNELLRFTQTGSAVNEFTLINAATTVRPTLRSSGEANIGMILSDSNSNELIIMTSTASAVNELTITNAATGANPSITASGGDTNIGFNLITKGTGVGQINGNEIYRVGGTDVTLADGGLNASLTASNGGIFYSTATAGAILAGTATAGQILRSGASAAPTWSTPTFPNAATTGTVIRGDGTNLVLSTLTIPDTAAISTILYASAANVISALATANSGVLVTSGTGVPSIAIDIPTAVTIGTAYVYRVSGTDVSVADGGTGVSTLGDAGVLIGNGTGAIQVTGAGTSGQVLTSNGAGVDPTFQAVAGAGAMTLLVANSGTSSSTTAVNLDTVAISGLTAKDTIVIYLTGEAVTAAWLSAEVVIYNNTDAVNIVETAINISAGNTANSVITVRQAQSAATKIMGAARSLDNTAAAVDRGNVATFTTAWTGSWTLALRNTGLDSGSINWSWAVFKVAGQ